jgi:hypothetical protein
VLRFVRIAAVLAAFALPCAQAQYYDPEVPEDTGRSYTALWWVPAESGWGLNTNHQDNKIFATLFTYAPDGEPMWLVGSALEGVVGGTFFTGELHRTTGPAFNAQPWDSVPIGYTRVGTMSIEFLALDQARLTYSYNGQNVTKVVQRLAFGSPVPECTLVAGSRASVVNYQDLWWDPAESGWGLNMVQQGTVIFATLFTYAPGGRDLWMVASGLTRGIDGAYSGGLQTTRGTTFNASPWTDVQRIDVGTMTLRFQSGDRATLSYTYNGTSVNKNIRRLEFGVMAPACR